MKKVVIVGGGISGLATAYTLQEKAKEVSQKIGITVLEKEKRLGGTMKSERLEGYLCEKGPPGFLDNKPETPKLVKDIGLTSQLLPSRDAYRRRYLYIDGALQKLPESPPAFLSSKILSFGGKLRVLWELWTKKAPEGVDETIAEFARRHIGSEAAEKLIDAVATGIYAGDSEKLSVKSCFPVMLDLEKGGRGSLIRGMIRRLRAKRKKEKETGVKSAGGGEMGGGKLTSFEEGMGTLIDGLNRAFRGDSLVTKEVSHLEKRNKDGYALYVEGQEEPVEADIVIIATPAYAASLIFRDFDKEIAEILAEISYVPVSVVNFGYPKKDVTHPLDGFGFLIPKREKRGILGTIWISSVFGGMAPQDHIALRTMVGGARSPEATTLNDETTIKLVQKELREIMGITADPTFVKIYRYPKAIPQYNVGHEKRLNLLDEQLEKYPGLFLTGNAYRGVGVNDCTRNANIIANQVIESLS